MLRTLERTPALQDKGFAQAVVSPAFGYFSLWSLPGAAEPQIGPARQRPVSGRWVCTPLQLGLRGPDRQKGAANGRRHLRRRV
jgi:hypothetical protein